MLSCSPPHNKLALNNYDMEAFRQYIHYVSRSGEWGQVYQQYSVIMHFTLPIGDPIQTSLWPVLGRDPKFGKHCSRKTERLCLANIKTQLHSFIKHILPSLLLYFTQPFKCPVSIVDKTEYWGIIITNTSRVELYDIRPRIETEPRILQCWLAL